MARGQSSGTLERSGDHDFFSFVANRTGRMTIDLRGTGGLDTVLAVYDTSGRRIALTDDFGGTRNSRVQVRTRAGQTYYVDAYGYGNSTGKYDVLINGGTIRTAGRSHHDAPSGPQGVMVLASDRSERRDTAPGSVQTVDLVLSQILRRAR